MYVQHCVDRFVCGWTSGLFPLWDLCKEAVVNISVQVFVWAPDFDPVGVCTKEGNSWIIWKLCVLHSKR